ALDPCLLGCTHPICHDPARLRFHPEGITEFRFHGRLILPAGEGVSWNDDPITIRLMSGAEPVVVATLPAGAAQRVSTDGARYADRAAVGDMGIGRLKVRKRGDYYVLSAVVYGRPVGPDPDPDMTTHVQLGAREWTLHALWHATSSGWKLTATSPLI